MQGFGTRVIELLAVLALTGPTQAASNISSNAAYSWAGNAGWLNWRPDAVNGVEIGQYICAGFLYSANLGWISMGTGAPRDGIQYHNDSAADYGVNMDFSGNLRGLAYGANIGWISFESTGAPHVDLHTGQLAGFAYGANIGWIALAGSTSLGVDGISPGADTDGDGIPDAWELFYVGNLTTLSANGDFDHDGVTDLEEYLADTNPMDPNDHLEVLSFSVGPQTSNSTLTWTTKTTRQYLIEVRSDFGAASTWHDSGLPPLVPTGSVSTETVPSAGPHQFFRIRAVRPLSN